MTKSYRRIKITWVYQICTFWGYRSLYSWGEKRSEAVETDLKILGRKVIISLLIFRFSHFSNFRSSKTERTKGNEKEQRLFRRSLCAVENFHPTKTLSEKPKKFYAGHWILKIAPSRNKRILQLLDNPIQFYAYVQNKCSAWKFGYFGQWKYDRTATAAIFQWKAKLCTQNSAWKCCLWLCYF